MDTETKRSGIVQINHKSCADCHTTRTPLWRGGPAGPRSLCNACGIRYRKRRRALLGLNQETTEKRRRKSSRSNRKLGFPLKLGEEEQAAILLMALSCGSVYA